MIRRRRSLLPRLTAAATLAAGLLTALAASLPSPASVMAAPLPPCVASTNGSVIVAAVSTNASTPTCLPQPGQVLVILIPGNQLTATSTPAGPGQSAETGQMSAITDTRIDSYAKRQTLRDQYRGQIDEVTFNDELGDGVGLDQALADAVAALHRPASPR